MDRSCLITGATSGIGRAAALALSGAGFELVLTGRNRAAADALLARLRRLHPAGRFHFLEADLAELAQVRALAGEVARRWPVLDVLINNAGARFDTYRLTPDGLEMTFALNHLAPFLLTKLLLPCLRRSPEGRIITVSSCAHWIARPGPWLPTPPTYDRRQAYARSKLANLLFTAGLTERLGHTPVSANAADPGIAATHFARNNGLARWLWHLAYHKLTGQLVSAARGAEALVFLAADPAAREHRGRLVRGRLPIPMSEAARDPVAAKELWELSARLVGGDGTDATY